MKKKKYSLEPIVFLSGAVVMIFELVGSRVMGPFLGTSIFVWSSLIGIILGSLSIGYYLGGRIADKRPTYEMLSMVIFAAAILVGVTILIRDPLLIFISSTFDMRLGSVIAALILFTPASIMLGMVSPYAVKLKMDDLKHSGATVGNLYAISTAGSIVGTFAAGFYLIPALGTIKLLITLAVVLVLISLLASHKKGLVVKIIFLLVFIAGYPIVDEINRQNLENNFIDIDTTYSRVWIYDEMNDGNAPPYKKMSINSKNSSAMYLNSDELVYEYQNFYHIAEHFNPSFKEVLMIGGAAYSVPKDFLKRYPEVQMDVVEIDPQLTELAKEHFRLKDDPRLEIFHEDGRTYLNRSQKKYDVILMDAFRSHFSIPFQLTTQELVKKEYDMLNEDGIVLANIVSSIEGDKGEFLRAEYATYKSIFPQVYIFRVRASTDPRDRQNLTLFAIKSEKKLTWENPKQEINEYLKRLHTETITNDMPILTDDFAPVDQYVLKAMS